LNKSKYEEDFDLEI